VTTGRAGAVATAFFLAGARFEVAAACSPTPDAAVVPAAPALAAAGLAVGGVVTGAAFADVDVAPVLAGAFVAFFELAGAAPVAAAEAAAAVEETGLGGVLESGVRRLAMGKISS
jgi:hypothetical protein